MTDKQTSSLSTLYQHRKARHRLPEIARKKLNPPVKHQRKSYWKVAVPALFASLMVIFVIWPNTHTSELQSISAEPELLLLDSFTIEESLSSTKEAEETAAIGLMAQAPVERSAAAPMAKSMIQNDISADGSAKIDQPAWGQSIWLYVESIGPLLMRDCMGNLVEIEISETLTAGTWILVSQRQGQWMIEDSQTQSPCIQPD